MNFRHYPKEPKNGLHCPYRTKSPVRRPFSQNRPAGKSVVTVSDSGEGSRSVVFVKTGFASG